MHLIRGMLIALTLVLGFPAVHTAEAWPTRPITIIVPYGAGGGTDILGRMVAKQLEKRLGQTVIVENRPGAGGVTGAHALMQAEPDGYTLLMAPSGIMAVHPTLMKKLPYDPAKDFTPLGLVAGTPFVMLVNADLKLGTNGPVSTLGELGLYGTTSGKPIPFATAGAGTPHHLFVEMLRGYRGLEVTYVAYKGTAPALTDVAAGHVPAVFSDLGPARGLIEAEKLRPIAVSTGKRLTALPHVPTLDESGAKGFDAASWQMLVAPSKTPKPVVEKLHAALKLGLGNMHKDIAERGMIVMPQHSLLELKLFAQSETKRWSDVVKKAGLAGSR